MLTGCNYFTQDTQLFLSIVSKYNLVYSFIAFDVTHLILGRKKIFFIKVKFTEAGDTMFLQNLITSWIPSESIWTQMWQWQNFMCDGNSGFQKYGSREVKKRIHAFEWLFLQLLSMMLSRLILTSREGSGGHIAGHIVCLRIDWWN